VVVVFPEDHRSHPQKSIERPGLVIHAKLLTPSSISNIFEIIHWCILGCGAERGDIMTVWLFSTKISFVSSFFETIFLLIDKQLKP
jgi:hypothetical protein